MDDVIYSKVIDQNIFNVPMYHLWRPTKISTQGADPLVLPVPSLLVAYLYGRLWKS